MQRLGVKLQSDVPSRIDGSLRGALGTLGGAGTGPSRLDPCREPAADVTAARYRGLIVDQGEQAERGERLDRPQSEGGAANAAAGNRQADQIHSVRIGAELLFGRLVPLHLCQVRPDDVVGRSGRRYFRCRTEHLDTR